MRNIERVRNKIVSTFYVENVNISRFVISGGFLAHLLAKQHTGVALQVLRDIG